MNKITNKYLEEKRSGTWELGSVRIVSGYLVVIDPCYIGGKSFAVVTDGSDSVAQARQILTGESLGIASDWNRSVSFLEAWALVRDSKLLETDGSLRNFGKFGGGMIFYLGPDWVGGSGSDLSVDIYGTDATGGWGYRLTNCYLGRRPSLDTISDWNVGEAFVDSGQLCCFDPASVTEQWVQDSPWAGDEPSEDDWYGNVCRTTLDHTAGLLSFETLPVVLGTEVGQVAAWSHSFGDVPNTIRLVRDHSAIVGIEIDMDPHGDADEEEEEPEEEEEDYEDDEEDVDADD